MKSKFLCFVCVICTIISVLAIIFAIANFDYEENHNYVEYAEVTSVSSDSVIMIVDSNNNIWCYYSDEYVREGDLIRVVFNNNSTKKIEDDEIVITYNLSNLTR